MNTSLLLMNKLFSMMLIAAVGFTTVRTGLLDAEDSKRVAKLSLYVLGPCLIISALQVELTPERLHGYIAALVFSLLVQTGFIGLGSLLRRLGFINVVEEMSVIYTNCGNLILPIISMTMGPEMVFYGSAYQLTFNLLFWTHCNTQMRGDSRIIWKDVLRNPNVIAFLIGIFLLLTGIPLPGPVGTAVDMMASAIGAVSMLVIGMSLAGGSLKEIMTFRRAYPILLIRLIIFPLLALGVLYVSGFLPRHPEFIPVLRISFLAIAAPPAANVPQLAALYDRDPVPAGIYNMLGNLFCILTIPLIDLAFSTLFL